MGGRRLSCFFQCYNLDAQLPDKIGGISSFRFRRMDSGFLTRLDAVQQPGHVPGEIAHGLQTFLILKHLLRGISMHHIPIGGTYKGHVGYGKIFVQLIQRGSGSGAAAACHGGAGLVNHAAFPA